MRGRRDSRDAPRLLNSQHRPGLGPVALELVVVALGWGEDVDDDRAEVEQRPVRIGAALTPDWPHALVAQPLGDAVADRAKLAFRAAGADDEVVRHRRELRDVEQNDVRSLLVLGGIDDLAGDLE